MRRAGFRALIVIAVILGAISDALAQGQPVETGSHWPIGLVFAGVVVLGVVLAYGIMRNRTRTRAEKQLTEDITAERYRSSNDNN